MPPAKTPLLTAKHAGERVELVFQGQGQGMVSTLVLARIVLGLALGPKNRPAGVVVGERVVWNKAECDHPSRYFIVLDTWRESNWSAFLNGWIAHKDRYLARRCVAGPLDKVAHQALATKDGLLAYHRRVVGTYRQAHPFFVGTDHTVVLMEKKPPAAAAQAAQVAAWIDEPTYDYTGAHPLRGPDGQPLKQVQFPPNLPNDEAVADVRTNRPAGLEALWQALHFLRTTPYYRRPKKEKERTANPITGY